MAVHYAGGGGGLFGSLMRGLGAVSALVPGMQPFAPYIGAAGALANGDVGGAIGSAAGPLLDGAQSAARAAAPAAPNESLMQALTRASRGNRPTWNSDPVTGEMNRFKNPRGWR